MNSKSVAVDESFINKPKEETIRGVDVTTMLSPFDVPQSVSFEFDELTRTAHFKFEYLSNEKTRIEMVRVLRGEYEVKLTLGKASNRVYEIELDLAHRSQPRISVLERILNGLKEYLTLHPDNKSGSFDAVGSVLKKYENRLMLHTFAC